MACPDGPEYLDKIIDVSRETRDRLVRHVDLLRSWQKAQNLVAPGTLHNVWRRHVADSAQIADLFPDRNTWLDLGSGAGFPGLVLAICAVGRPDFSMTLVESNRRKAAFLRAVIRETGAPARVLCERIDPAKTTHAPPADVITARALAPLERLFDLARPFAGKDSVCVFHKGQDFVSEIEKATQSWKFDLLERTSKIDPAGRILIISHLKKRY